MLKIKYKRIRKKWDAELYLPISTLHAPRRFSKVVRERLNAWWDYKTTGTFKALTNSTDLRWQNFVTDPALRALASTRVEWSPFEIAVQKLPFADHTKKVAVTLFKAWAPDPRGLTPLAKFKATSGQTALLSYQQAYHPAAFGTPTHQPPQLGNRLATKYGIDHPSVAKGPAGIDALAKTIDLPKAVNGEEPHYTHAIIVLKYTLYYAVTRRHRAALAVWAGTKWRRAYKKFLHTVRQVWYHADGLVFTGEVVVKNLPRTRNPLNPVLYDAGRDLWAIARQTRRAMIRKDEHFARAAHGLFAGVHYKPNKDRTHAHFTYTVTVRTPQQARIAEAALEEWERKAAKVLKDKGYEVVVKKNRNRCPYASTNPAGAIPWYTLNPYKDGDLVVIRAQFNNPATVIWLAQQWREYRCKLPRTRRTQAARTQVEVDTSRGTIAVRKAKPARVVHNGDRRPYRILDVGPFVIDTVTGEVRVRSERPPYERMDLPFWEWLKAMRDRYVYRFRRRC